MDNKEMVTVEYGEKYQYKTDYDSIQQSADKIKYNYGNCVYTSSELAKKRYKKNLNCFMETFIPNSKLHKNKCKKSKELRINFKGYQYFSLKSLIDSHFDSQNICWMAQQKFVIPNVVFVVTRLEIVHEIIITLNYTRSHLNLFDQHFYNSQFMKHTNKLYGVKKSIKLKFLS